MTFNLAGFLSCPPQHACARTHTPTPHLPTHAATKFIVILESKMCSLLSIFSGWQKQIQLVRMLMRSVSSRAACIWGTLSQARTEVARLQSRASSVPLSQHLPMGGSCKETSTVGGKFQSLLSPHMRKRGWGLADFYVSIIVLQPFLSFLFISILCPNGPIICILGLQVHSL